MTANFTLHSCCTQTSFIFSRRQQVELGYFKAPGDYNYSAPLFHFSLPREINEQLANT